MSGAEEVVGPEAVPQWATDSVLVELQKGPQSKEDLQEAVGMGPGDLRRTLDALVEDGVIRETEDGWEADPTAEPSDVLSQDVAEHPLDMPPQPEEPEEAPGGAEPQGEVPEAATGPYRARVLLEVNYQPEGEPVSEAHELREAAIEGILTRYPDLTVGGQLIDVVVFDTPRRIYP